MLDLLENRIFTIAYVVSEAVYCCKQKFYFERILNMTSVKKRLILIGILFLLILVFCFYVYNYFIKLAPVEFINGRLVYNGSYYKSCDCHNYYKIKTDKCLGAIRNEELSFFRSITLIHIMSISQVYTVKNDPENNFLQSSGFLFHHSYVKEDIFEQHIKECGSSSYLKVFEKIEKNE